MSFELVNTFGTLLTVAIIAATAIAAMVQLRHLRAGNQINALLTIDEKFQGSAFYDALLLVRARLPRAFEDPAFREYVAAVTAGRTPPEVSQEYKDLRSAARLIGNRYEELGLLIKKGTIEASVFLDVYSNSVLSDWNSMEKYTAFNREVFGSNALFENFEYLAVLSEDWLKTHPSTYPRGMRRMQLHNPWPMPPVPATA